METKLKTEEFLKSLNIENLNLMDYVDIQDIDLSNAFESIFDMLDEKDAFNIEIIYYYNAMEYLREHDFSLNQSLEIAQELGYKITDLNSELLASLLASQNARNDFYEKEEEIKNFFYSLNQKEICNFYNSL
jgi:hypothetical protein